MKAFADRYRGRRVLVTGHTGFKGSWLCEWLSALGAEVTGLALDPNTQPALLNQLELTGRLKDHRGDVRDAETVWKCVERINPEFVFHLSAQPLLRLSYERPVETYATNVMGTVHLLNAVRRLGKPCVVVVVTTDKCYENREWVHSYREEDSIGGHDTSSSSKGAAELLLYAYRKSYFSQPESTVRLASARAGNVIGGGDWALDRIVPDCVRSLRRGESIPVRNKIATRPWQHVLEPFSGYLWLGACLANLDLCLMPMDANEKVSTLASRFNFGLNLGSNQTAARLAQEVLKHWPGSWDDRSHSNAAHEATCLNLAIDKAYHTLGRAPVWSFNETLARTVRWYRNAESAPPKLIPTPSPKFPLTSIKPKRLGSSEPAYRDGRLHTNPHQFSDYIPGFYPTAMHTPAELKAEILRLTRDYSNLVHQANWPAPVREMEFEPGETVIPYAGRVFTADEVEAAVGSALDFWLTLGPEGEAFERELSHYLGVRHTLLVNSGSSANLVALSALTTHKLSKERRILPGDEVITVAAGFPTTVAPIIQNSAVAVFVDNDPCTGNIRVDQLELAYREGKTKAVMMAHALGNPFDIGAVLAFCRRYNLWLIEDNCDALGSTYTMPEAEARTLELDHLLAHATSGTHPNIYFETTPTGERLLTAPTGSWGDLSTQSFYPPHHITMGEGGAVNIVSKAALKSYAESFRDWGRDCWCASGKDDSCKRRFGWQLGELPKGYDHKYVYSHLGYNLKPLDLQAAIGRQQLKRLPEFINLRKANWQRLRDGLANLEEFFEFSLPCHAVAWQKENIKDPSAKLPNFAWAFDNKRVECSWFGFMLRVKSSAPFSHTDLAQHLSREKIGSRMFFGGNLLRQPIFIQMKKSRPDAFRAVVDCKGADLIMNSAIFLGTYPGLSSKMIDYEINKITQFAKHK